MTPRLAVSLAPYQRDPQAALARALDDMRRAQQAGAEVLVFPEWFLGLNPLERFPDRLLRTIMAEAQARALLVVAGSMRCLDPETGVKQQRAWVIDSHGEILGGQSKCEFYAPERPWFEPGQRIRAVVTPFGRLVLLSGLDAVDEGRWQECLQERPDWIVMATGARTHREHAQLVDLAVARSALIGGTVVLAPLTGRFGGVTYCGGGLVASHGRVVAEAGSDTDLLLALPERAPLIQLGAVDASAWASVAAPPPGYAPADPAAPREIEPERRVLLDWGLLLEPDPEAGGRRLLAHAHEQPRSVALAPLVPGHRAALERLLDDGAEGAFAWPAASRCPPGHDAWLDGLDALAERGHPVVVQMAPGPYPLMWSRPTDLDRWLTTFPALPVVVVGAGRPAPWWDETIFLAALRPRLYFDLGGMEPAFVDRLLASVDPRRIVLGTGGGLVRFPVAWAALQAMATRHALSDGAVKEIAGETARRLWWRREVLRPLAGETRL